MSFLRGSLLILIAVFASAALAADPPRFEVGDGPPKIRGFAVGTKIAWMALVRERIHDQSHMTILRGVETVNAGGDLGVDRIDRDFSRSLWLLADLDGDTVVHGAAPQYPPAPETIAVRAVAGETSVTIQGASVHLTWIRRNGGGVWIFAGGDGGDFDADETMNGALVVPLAAMKPLQGNAQPPATLAPGDLLFLIDPEENRTAVVKVSE